MPRVLFLAALLAAAPVMAAAQEAAGLFVAPWGEPVRGAADEAPVAVWFRTTDANQDGRHDLEEYLARAERFFTAIDRNSDGRVTALESTALFRAVAPDMLAPSQPARATAAMQPQPGSVLRPRERTDGDEPRGAARFGLFGDFEPVMSCDTDISRFVTREEFAACVTRRFGQLDANDDGAFELAESPRAAALMTPVRD